MCFNIFACSLQIECFFLFSFCDVDDKHSYQRFSMWFNIFHYFRSLSTTILPIHLFHNFLLSHFHCHYCNYQLVYSVTDNNKKWTANFHSNKFFFSLFELIFVVPDKQNSIIQFYYVSTYFEN